MSHALRPNQDQVDDLVLDLLPPQGQWTEEAYLCLTDNSNRLVEFTDGYLELLPMPTDRHQTILSFLYDAFRAVTRATGGKVLFAPLRLRIRDRKYREPDLVLVRDAADPRRKDRYWLGADLVLEVVSPDRPDRDLVEKRVDYAEAAIPEYWIVNPLDETVTVLELQGQAYAERGLYSRGDVARSVLLDVSIKVGDIFDTE